MTPHQSHSDQPRSVDDARMTLAALRRGPSITTLQDIGEAMPVAITEPLRFIPVHPHARMVWEETLPRWIAGARDTAPAA